MGENLFVSGSRRDPPGRDGQRDPRYYPPRPPKDPTNGGRRPRGDEHPGMANYPSDGVDYRRQRRSSTPSANRYLPDLEARSSNRGEPPPAVGAAAGRGVNNGPRSAAQRSR